jgi:DNA-binding transcriptional regulator YiaG
LTVLSRATTIHGMVNIATTADSLHDLALVRAMTESGEAREIRQRARVSLTEMAGAVGVAPATVARWEVADRRPRGDAALRYLRVLQSLQGLREVA